METEACWIVPLDEKWITTNRQDIEVECWGSVDDMYEHEDEDGYYYPPPKNVLRVTKSHSADDSSGRRFKFSFVINRSTDADKMEMETKIEKIWPSQPRNDKPVKDVVLGWSYSVKLELLYNGVVITTCSGSWKGRLEEELTKTSVGVSETVSNAVINADLLSHDDFMKLKQPKQQNELKMKLAFKFKVEESASNPKVESVGLKVEPCSRHLLDKMPKDVKIQCGKEEFQAHKLALCCCSDVFRRMFESKLKESTKSRVVIEDFEPGTVKDLISFVYNGTVTASTKESLVALLDCAEKYEIAQLKLAVLKKMIACLNPENAAEFAAASLKYRADETIKSALFNYCKANFARLTTSEEFKQFFKDNVDLFL